MMADGTSGGPPPTPTVRILLVEDSRAERQILRGYLETAGSGAFALIEAETLAQGLELLLGGSIDLVFLDLGLPDSWGLDTLHAMHAAAPRIPIVVFTGANDQAQALRAIQGGAQDYLVKGSLTKTAILRIIRYTLERYRLENALRESEEKFRTIADFTGDWEYWIRPDETIVYMNPACRAITGYGAGEFSADPGLIERIVHPDDREAFQTHHQQAVSISILPGTTVLPSPESSPGGSGPAAGGQVHPIPGPLPATPESTLPTLECEFRVVRRDGQLRWISHLCHPVIGPDGSNRGRRVSNRDVTAKKEAERAMRLNESRLASLLEISHYPAHTTKDLLDFALQRAIALTDSAFGYLLVRDPARGVFTVSSWSNQVLSECEIPLPPGSLDIAAVGHWAEAARQERPIVVNECGPPGVVAGGTPPGHLPLTRWMSIPIIQEEEIVSIVGLANKPDKYLDADVLQITLLMEGVWRVKSEREAIDEVRRLNVRLEELVANRTSELAAAMRELESFSYSVSHDLRAPLRSLDGFSLALLEEYGELLDATGKDYLGRIRAASARMAALIDNLLQLSRVAGHALARTAVDLSALARELIAELRRETPDREVDVAIENGLVVQGDAHLLRIVLDNLLGNAWKFTARTPGARIEVGSRAVGDRREFFVRDNGAGFDQSYADKLFVPFQRLHSVAEFPGTGIGLTIVKRIVSRHGGAIRVEGRPGAGALFAFTLPESA